MEKNACGILSYAGIARDTLLSLAKAAFVQSQPPVPQRFETFLPLFPIELIQYMDYVGITESRGARVSPSGFSIDPAEYHLKLYTQLPDLYAEDNYARNFDYEGRYVGRGVFAVDRTWVDHFPQYQPFMGEKLMIYLIGGGFQAVAVPESVYPRGGGVLEAAELAMQVTQRANLFVQYTRARIAGGDRYAPETFAADFLNKTGLTVTQLTQKDLGQTLQDLSIIRNLQCETSSVGLFTENARRAERVLQYTPMKYACDQFDTEAVDKHTARLAQLHSSDSDFISDLWIPYQDFYAYVNKQTMTLDVRRLCEGYQIAPRYDPETRGGRYPDAVRVAVIRDRSLALQVGEVINNPAYGDGMSPQGIIGRQVYITDSREMIRQRKLSLEEVSIATENLTLPPDAYRKCLMLAVLQEHKGRLVDTMYRRETALAQINPDMPVYAKACALLNERVDKLAEIVKRESAQSGMSQMSGYDADIDYLRRKQRDREGVPEEQVGAKPIAFARDALREQNIESGYAMRAGLLRMSYADAALPELPAEQTLGTDDSEEEPVREPLPPIPAQTVHPSATPETVAAKPIPATSAASGTPSVTPPGSAAPATPEASALETVTKAESHPPVTAPADAPAPSLNATPDAVEKGARDIGVEAPAAPDGISDPALRDEGLETPGTAQQQTAVNDVSRPTLQPSGDDGETPPQNGDAALSTDRSLMADDAAIPMENAETDATLDDSAIAEPDAAAETSMPASASAAVKPDTETNDSAVQPDTEANDSAVQPDAEADESAAETDAAPHRHVSLRELTDRIGQEAEPPAQQPAEPEATEPAKPKLAYFVRRGSEATASKAYSRMSELLHKQDHKP